jgi:hypothetical protein
MELRSIKSFERRWNKLRALARAQLKDFERDQREIAKQIRRYKLKKDVQRMRQAVAHQRRVRLALKSARTLLAARDTAVKGVRRSGRLLKRAVR